jgi:4'-phosphopantetheinyl transferase
MTGWLTRSLADVPAGDAWLGPGERVALARLVIEKRRADWRLGRYAAKTAVGTYLGVDPARVEILATPGGAPVARLDGARADVELSLSHRAGRALAVLAPSGTRVGCDLELVEARSTAFVEQWLAAAEQAFLRRARTGDRAWLANLMWSAKEAATKARGEGLRLDVRHAQVTFGVMAGADGWRRLHVDWGDDAPDDDGWFRREPSWVIAVVGGDPETPPRVLQSGQRPAPVAGAT